MLIGEKVDSCLIADLLTMKSFTDSIREHKYVPMQQYTLFSFKTSWRVHAAVATVKHRQSTKVGTEMGSFQKRASY